MYQTSETGLSQSCHILWSVSSSFTFNVFYRRQGETDADAFLLERIDTGVGSVLTQARSWLGSRVQRNPEHNELMLRIVNIICVHNISVCIYTL